MRLPLIGNQPMQDISERLYYQIARVWISSIDKLDFTSEVGFFADEVKAVISALEDNDVSTAFMVQRVHLSMAFHRM